MSRKYNPQAVERAWQEAWERDQVFRATEDPAREKYYLLVMFPYPSGRIHMGHVRNYAIGDILARYQRMRGKNVLQPMGWDAFGMPAENAAMASGAHPGDWTHANIATMRRELRSMGLSYDWSRELATCDPEYAHWEQRLFLKLHEKGLVQRKISQVNWDPVDQTVLANEQVIDGKGWRSGAPVVRKELAQWFLSITAYAEELLAGIDGLSGWPEAVRAMQANWIGKSHGVAFSFALRGRDETLPVFTTRPDTVMGVTFCSVAPEHPLAREAAARDPAVAAFIAECGQGGTSEENLEKLAKKGIATGLYAVHPFTGEEVPVFVANFVLMSYGSGAVMAVPAHDQRDFEFARNHGLPVKVVIQPKDRVLDPAAMTEAYTGPGVLVNSGRFDGLDNDTARERIALAFQEMGIGRATIQYRLRDWGISRQRYWGNPIPFVHCPACGVVPETRLPITLPREAWNEAGGGTRGNPLALHPTWKWCDCPRCGAAAQRETDTMDTFVESSWYFLRYCCPDHPAPLDRTRVDYWMPVDQYVGGVEHAVLHLLYARFFHKALRDVGEVSCDEPFTRLLTQGMVRKDTHRCPTHGWRYPSESVAGEGGTLLCSDCRAGIQVGRNEKMSKSKKNVVDPNDLIRGYGSDTARLFMLFAAPPEKDLEWSDAGVDGAWRFLARVWRLVLEGVEKCGGATAARTLPGGERTRKLYTRIHETILRVTQDLERSQFNTGISAIMELVNAGSDFLAATPAPGKEEAAVLKAWAETVVILLNPYAPHVTEELWRDLGHADYLCLHAWPAPDPAALVREEVTLVVQVNGKLRSRLTVAADCPEEELIARAMADPKVAAHLVGLTVKRTVVAAGRLVNLVAG